MYLNSVLKCSWRAWHFISEWNLIENHVYLPKRLSALFSWLLVPETDFRVIYNLKKIKSHIEYTFEEVPWITNILVAMTLWCFAVVKNYFHDQNCILSDNPCSCTCKKSECRYKYNLSFLIILQKAFSFGESCIKSRLTVMLVVLLYNDLAHFF